jgi:uncharacterized membrane protein YccC
MTDPVPSPQIAPPVPLTFQFASLFRLRKPAVRRWPFALRAAFAMGAPVIVGWCIGDISAGMMATIGSFTSVYGADRPFLNRAAHLGCIAVAFAVVVLIGVSAAHVPWLVVPAITRMAMAAAFLCNALKVGPPGAYLFTLACAAGTAMGAAHLLWWHVGGLVLAGGAFAWVLHMAGAVFSPRGPEISALKLAAKAVADFLDAAGTPRADATRHQAATALHQAWTTLVGQQPVQPRPDGTLSRLRAEARELHMIFAEAINAMAAGQPIEPRAIDRVNAILRRPEAITDVTDPGHVPLGRVSGWQLLREGIQPGAQSFEIGLRVGIAAAIAGLIGWVIGLDHAYWATAAAVLMLHQGLDWATTLQRGIQRVGGTVIGLLLAGAILGLHPQGIWIAVSVMVLQFIIEILVLRNYGLAVIFITAVALTIASGGHPIDNPAPLLWSRAADTIIGCAVGLIVFALMARRSTTGSISHELVRTWAAIDIAASLLAEGKAVEPAVRTARRNLQHHTILLLQSFDSSVGNGDTSRVGAEPLWPAVVATQRLAYRLLSSAWQIEAVAAAERMTLARQLFGDDGAQRLHISLAAIASAVRNDRGPPTELDAPAFLATEIGLLGSSLVTASKRG